MDRGSPPNIVALLADHAVRRAESVAVTWLAEDGATEESRSYAGLDRRSRAVARALSAQAKPGERALILCPAGLPFVEAILGCFYAGVVAVPAYPPGNSRQSRRIQTIWNDAEAVLILSTTAMKERIESWLGGESRPYRFLCVDGIDEAGAEAWTPPALAADSLAFLQYTSGSTSEPKGVMVSHGNLMANLGMIREAFRLGEGDVVGGWLPMFHDMGLVGNLLEPLSLGLKTVLMSPVAFVRKPVRWLELVSKHRVSVMGGPNFGYRLCADNLAWEQCQGLDLGSLRLAYCGAEPIDWRVLDRFAEKFGPCGFRKAAFYPCYGLAEATLFVTGVAAGAGPAYLALDADALAAHQALPSTDAGARVLVGCGQSPTGQELRVVDPDTRLPLAEGRVGEIWLRGPHVAQGYWGKPELSAEMFQAGLAEGGGTYLRTGDLGFLRDGNLYIAGRSKDVIILRGRNYYPQDIERTVAESHPALQPDGGAAFAVEVDGETKVVVVQELRRAALRGLPVEEVVGAMRRAVFDQHELALHSLLLLKPASLPKTSSGKVRRAASRAAFLEGALEGLYAWSQAAVAQVGPGGSMIDEEEGSSMAYGQGGDLIGEGASSCGTDSRSRADEAIAWLRAYAECRVDSRLIDERRTIPPYIVLDFGNHGLLGIQAPVAVGGLGLNHRDAFRVVEQVAAIDPTLASFVGVHNALGLRPLLRYGSAAQKQRLLPLIAQGRELASFAFTEPGAGSNPLGIESTATPDGKGGWRLRGSKKWIGSAAWAGYIHVFAHLLNEQGQRRGLAGFTVRQGAPGFVQGAEELTMGMRGMVQNTIHLNDVAVRPEDMLGEPGQGMLIAQDIMEFGRTGISAAALGIMKRSAQLMARYARRRPMATGRLIDNVLSRDRLTQLTIEIAALEALLYRFADWLDAGLDVPKEYYAAIKVLAAESAFRGVDFLMQMLGGRGYVENNNVPQMLRDVRLLRIFEGPSETMQMFVGSRLAAGSPSFSDFLRNILQAGELASQLEDAANILKSHAVTEPPEGVDGWRDGQRIAFVLGELGSWALWLAVVEQAARGPEGGKLERAAAWLRQRYEGSLARARRARPDQFRPLGVAEIEGIIAAYAEQIGDVQQHQPGVLDRPDPLLCREQASPGDNLAWFVEKTPPAKPAEVPVAAVAVPPADARQSQAIEQWLRQWVAGRMGRDGATIGATQPFADFGLDSLTALELTEQLEQWLGIPISPTATWDFPNIQTLAAYLASEGAGPAPAKLGAVPAAPVAASSAALDELSESELAALLAGELGSHGRGSPNELGN